MAKLKRNSLTKEIIFLVLSGFAAAFILFLILFQVGTTLLSEYFTSSNFIYNSETSYINELTEFVHKKKLAATDTDQLGDWAHQKGIRHFTISRERVPIRTLSFWEILLNRILYITIGNIFIRYLFLMEMQTFTFMRIMN